MKLAIGIIILIICCILAFLIPYTWSSNNCVGGTYSPSERRITMFDWIVGLDWYWVAGILAAIAAAFYWFFVKE